MATHYAYFLLTDSHGPPITLRQAVTTHRHRVDTRSRPMTLMLVIAIPLAVPAIVSATTRRNPKHAPIRGRLDLDYNEIDRLPSRIRLVRLDSDGGSAPEPLESMRAELENEGFGYAGSFALDG